MDNHLRRGCSLPLLGLMLLAAACASNAGATATAGAAGASAGAAGNTTIPSGGAAGSVLLGGGGGSAGSASVAGGGGSVSATGNGGSAGQSAPGPCTPPVDIDTPSEKLSLTGCMSATDHTKFAALVIPYEVNSPLWSDSADKQRGMVVPAGQTVHVKDCVAEASTCTQGPADTGKWVFPVGTVMLKNFLFDNKLVETRLFVHHDDQTWVGYSYQWDEAQTDATIVPDERRNVMFNTGTRSVPWNYPSRTDCMKCHNPMAGSTIGPQTRQMNRMLGGTNQIDKLKTLAFFDKPPSAPYQEALVTPYPGQAGMPSAGATIEQEVRSYMEANCAFCHRPDGDFANLDLRFDTVFKNMNLCNVDPMQGDVGVQGSKNLVPMLPMQSVAWLRMNALPNEGRMPQIGTYQVDAAGVKLMGDWINSIKSCP